MNSTEQKIREAFEKAMDERRDTSEEEKGSLPYFLFKSGYMALLSELEEWEHEEGMTPVYLLPEGVEK